PSAVAAVAAPSAPEPLPRPAERRLVTILCCQILGLAALAGERDPEEAQDVLAALHRSAARLFVQYRGMILRQSGDGVVACFGYPQAGESDAERAVRAGLGLVEAVAWGSLGLRLRIGIATSPAVIGALFGGAVGAIGETPEQAERLAAAAPEGGIVIGETTRRLVGRMFEYRAAATLRLEGGETLPAWQVVGEAPFAGRFAARRAPAGELVGRAEELALLLRRWWQARHGSGQGVLLSGEPGIGKSRLALAFAERLAGEQHVRMRCFGSPHHRNTELFPIIGHLERAAGFARGDSAEDKLAKLASMAAEAGCDAGEDLHLLASLMSLPAEEAVLARLGPKRRRERTLSVLMGMIERLAAEQPVVAICEDAQWFDPTSRDLLALIVERAQRLPLLLLVTARPSFAPPWADHPQVMVVPLTRLPQREAATLIGQTAGDRPLAEETVAELLARGDGVPLFLEELIKAALAGDPVGHGRRGEIPATLQGLLLSRLDRLGEAREIAQLGAVIGPSFSHELLSLLAGSTACEAALDRLVAAALVYRQGAPPDAVYRFKHALVRDAAYASLPQRRRRELHGRAALALEEKFPEVVAAEPELLAHHHAEAGDPARAVDYLLAAGERALVRSAGAEARAHVETALRLLFSLPEEDKRHHQELRAQILLHRVGITTRGRTAPEVGQALQRARALCMALDDQTQLPSVIFGQWYNAWSAAAFAEAEVHARTLANWAERRHSAEARTFAEYALGLCRLNCGLLREAGEHLETAHALDRFDGLPGMVAAGYWAEGSVRVSSFLMLQICLFLLGRLEEASRIARAARDAGRAMSHPYARALALILTCRNQALRRDPHSLLETASALIELAEEQGYPDMAAHAMVYRGWALAMTGACDQGLVLVQSGVERCRALGYLIWHSQMLMLRAECQWRGGDAGSALAALAEAGQAVAQTGERILEAELHRLRGAIARKSGRQPGMAEQSLIQALETACGQGARLLELRAATDLARLWAEQGRRREAANLLAPILGAFAVDLDLPDIRQAAAVMAMVR
ncbi:MAG TPA: AAA family ATPase, partial [Stellaceae bacterium]|nr:AAA family ATPase [Stellaceae bacterium]